MSCDEIVKLKIQIDYAPQLTNIVENETFSLLYYDITLLLGLFNKAFL